MITYNNINVPHSIKTNRIISAFQNEMDFDKVEKYTAIMKELMLSHDFPPIMGYPRIIDEDDIGENYLNGEPVEFYHVGQLVWMVTDGHVSKRKRSIRLGLLYNNE